MKKIYLVEIKSTDTMRTLIKKTFSNLSKAVDYVEGKDYEPLRRDEETDERIYTEDSKLFVAFITGMEVL